MLRASRRSRSSFASSTILAMRSCSALRPASKDLSASQAIATLSESLGNVGAAATSAAGAEAGSLSQVMSRPRPSRARNVGLLRSGTRSGSESDHSAATRATAPTASPFIARHSARGIRRFSTRDANR